MFSTEDRCIYTQNQLAEVICQLRFSEILTIETELPAAFQEEIRSVFPQYSVRRENAGPDKQVNNYQFATPDGVWRINLSSGFISLACTKYPRWETFATMLDKPLTAFIRLYHPAYFERIGLRYLNFFSRRDLKIESLPLRELITPQYLSVLTDMDVNEATTARCTVDLDVVIHGGSRAKIHAGPGKVNRNGVVDPETKYIFDLDLFMAGNIPVSTAAGALETLHRQSYGIFRGAITDTLHDAMHPCDI